MMCRERWGGPLSVPFGAWEVCPNDGGPRRCQRGTPPPRRAAVRIFAVVRRYLVRRLRKAVGMGESGHPRHAAWRRGTTDGAGGKGDD